jgi:hypothetical protein
MATSPHGKLLLVSSPYTMSGALWDIWRQRDVDPDTLVWRAPTALMNPTVSARFLAKEQARDPENFRREYLAEFTEAISGFLCAEVIERCVVPGRTEVPPQPDQFFYVAAIDAAYKGDCFTLCVAHNDPDCDRVVVDHLQGWQGSRQQPLRLSEVLPQIEALGQRYGFGRVFGDQFGAEPLKEAFRRHGLYYQERTFTPISKADIYATLRSRLQDRTVELLDHGDSLRELRALEIESLPGGGTRIGHPRNGHDDYADALALAVSEARYHAPPCVSYV